MGALSWLNVETAERALTTLFVFGKFVRCSAHGHSFARLWYVEVVWTRWGSVCLYFVTAGGHNQQKVGKGLGHGAPPKLFYLF